MMLQKIVLQGFKSFVKKTTLEFSKPVVAIVGPNGAGKSNIADAFRWVMGEQSTKLLRTKKSEDLIFNGSKTLSRLNMTQVDLYFSNEDGRLDVDFPEVVISRKLYRTGESEYLINKKQVRLQDVVLLLAKANFGQKSFGVIGQGEITDVLNATPQERKTFFDEATGIKEFQIKRNEAINKLIRSEENLKQAEIIFAELEPRLKNLEKQVKRFEEKKSKEEELQQIQILYYGSVLLSIRKQKTEVQKILHEENKKQKALEEKRSKIQNQIQIFYREGSRETLYHRLQGEYQKLLDQRNQLLKERVILLGEKQLEKETRGEESLVILERELDSITQEIKNFLQEEDVLREDLQNMDSELRLKYSELQKIESKINSFEEEREGLQGKLEKMQGAPLIRVREPLLVLFERQKQFLKHMKQTRSMAEFKEAQKEASSITQELENITHILLEKDQASSVAFKSQISVLQKNIQTLAQEKNVLLVTIHDVEREKESKKGKRQLLQSLRKQKEEEREKRIREIQHESEKSKSTDGASFEVYEKKIREKDHHIALTEETLKHKEQALANFNREEENKTQKIRELQTLLYENQKKLDLLLQEKRSLEIEFAKEETKEEDVVEELHRDLPHEQREAAEHIASPHPRPQELLQDRDRIKSRLLSIGTVDEETREEYRKTKERVEFLRTQIHDLHTTIRSLDQLITKLDETMKKEFSLKFRQIQEHFERYFKMLFAGGHAKLSLLTEEEKLQEPTAEPEKISLYSSLGAQKKKQKIILGVEIEAAPPGKKVHSIYALSGGEKSLTSLSLISAIIAVSQPPFVILDEVEAALDEMNSEKFSEILKRLSKETQFIVITHNRITMHASSVLYGITLSPDHTSKLISLELTQAEKILE